MVLLSPWPLCVSMSLLLLLSATAVRSQPICEVIVHFPITVANPTNILANDSCCDTSETAPCTTSCNTGVILCFYPPDSLEKNPAKCPLGRVIIGAGFDESPNTTRYFHPLFESSLQIYVRLFQRGSAPMAIQAAIIDELIVVVNNNTNVSTVQQQGDHGVANISLTVGLRKCTITESDETTTALPVSTTDKPTAATALPVTTADAPMGISSGTIDNTTPIVNATGAGLLNSPSDSVDVAKIVGGAVCGVLIVVLIVIIVIVVAAVLFQYRSKRRGTYKVQRAELRDNSSDGSLKSGVLPIYATVNKENMDQPPPLPPYYDIGEELFADGSSGLEPGDDPESEATAEAERSIHEQYNCNSMILRSNEEGLSETVYNYSLKESAVTCDKGIVYFEVVEADTESC